MMKKREERREEKRPCNLLSLYWHFGDFERQKKIRTALSKEHDFNRFILNA